MLLIAEEALPRFLTLFERSCNRAVALPGYGEELRPIVRLVLPVTEFLNKLVRLRGVNMGALEGRSDFFEIDSR